MAGLGGNLFSSLYFKYGVSVGASGAIFGLLGCEAAYISKNYRRF
jgi:membrane associated rhomboid family serine protease